MGAPDVCPFEKKGLGDTIERIAKPIARALGLPCLDENGELRPESGCAKRKQLLNNLTLNKHPKT